MTLQKTNMKKYILIVIFCFPVLLFAQEDWNQEGDLEDSQIIIEKDRKLDLPRASRDFKKVPQITQEKADIPVSFSSKAFIPVLSSLQPRIRVLTVQDEKLEKLYANQVKVGAGNYWASYFEGNFANKRSTDRSYGLNVFHHSFANGVIDKGNSGSGYQHIKPFGSMIFKKAVLQAEAFYERNNNYLYGYDSTIEREVDKDSLQRTFHTIGAKIALKDRNINSKYHYDLGLDVYGLFTNYESGEFAFDFQLKNSYAMNENWGLYLNTDGFISTLKFNSNMISQNRNLIRVKPGVEFKNEKFVLKLGLNFAHENDTLAGMNKMHVYPDLNMQYSLVEKLTLFAGLKGDVRANRYKDMVDENPYLNDVIAVSNALIPFQFYGGFTGSVSNFLGYNAGFSLSSVQHNFGYVAVLDEAEGEIRYRPEYFVGDNTEANVYASMSANVNQFSLNLRGDYFYYSVGETELMPFRPAYQLQLATDYLIAKKLKIGLNAHLQGKMNYSNDYIQDFATYSISVGESIPAIYDLGIKFSYKISDRSQVFLHANNLIANKYEYFIGYPNRGFQLLGGFTYSF